jgi:hypothetical protein
MMISNHSWHDSGAGLALLSSFSPSCDADQRSDKSQKIYRRELPLRSEKMGNHTEAKPKPSSGKGLEKLALGATAAGIVINAILISRMVALDMEFFEVIYFIGFSALLRRARQGVDSFTQPIANLTRNRFVPASVGTGISWLVFVTLFQASISLSTATVVAISFASLSIILMGTFSRIREGREGKFMILILAVFWTLGFVLIPLSMLSSMRSQGFDTITASIDAGLIMTGTLAFFFFLRSENQRGNSANSN